MQAQKDHSPKVFLPGFYNQWFAKFPEGDGDEKGRELTEEERAKHKEAVKARKDVHFFFLVLIIHRGLTKRTSNCIRGYGTAAVPKHLLQKWTTILQTAHEKSVHPLDATSI
jgi:hypothetical protein